MLIKRRSIREYTDESISPDVIEEIIQDAILAPNSRNDQPWQFIIVADKIFMKRISDEAKKIILETIEGNPDDYAEKYKTMLADNDFDIFYGAPSVVFIIGEKELENMKLNCSLAGCYFVLSAASRGLGTCWINFATFIKSPDLLNDLGVPEECGIAAAITVGYASKIPAIPGRKPAKIIRILN